MKKFDVCFNLGFGMEVEAEDEYEAEQIFRNMSDDEFCNFVRDCMNSCAYVFDDDVDVNEWETEQGCNMDLYKIIDFETLAKEIVESPLVYEKDIACDFDYEFTCGDVVDESEVSCFYQLRKVYMADTVLIACVYYGGQIGNAFLFDINTEYVSVEEVTEELAIALRDYLDVCGDTLIAVKLYE